MNSVVDYLAYLVVRIAICVVQATRIETCARFTRLLAILAGDVFKLRRQVIDDNLRLALPDFSEADRKRLTRAMWEHLFLMVVEIAHTPRKIHDTTWRRYIRFENKALMMRTLFADRPTVAISGHYGNFELVGYTLGLFGFETYTVARPLDNRFLDRFILQFRTARGQHFLPKNGSAGEIAQMLAARGTLSVLADQHAGPKGCWVQFFGNPASTHKAIALFSLTNDAPIMVGFGRRLGAPLNYEMGITERVDPRELAPHERGVPELTQWFTSALERIIRVAPEQYWWVHRRWKDNRAASKQPKASRAKTTAGS